MKLKHKEYASKIDIAEKKLVDKIIYKVSYT